MSRDFWAVAAIVLLLFAIMQQAVMGNALARLEAVLEEIYQQAEEGGGWVLIEFREPGGDNE